MAWTISLAVLAALTGAAQMLDQKLDPHTWEWVHEPKVQVSLVGALIAVTLMDTIRRTIVRIRMPSRTKQQAQVRNHLSTLIVTLAGITGQPAGEFGCGLFLIQERGFRRPRRLVRTQRVRLIDDLFESNVLFTPGKGTVGQCWKAGGVRHKDWALINRRYDGDEITEKRWEEMLAETQRGFTLKEFRSMVCKYSEVLAVPVTIDNVFVGCIAVELKWNKDAPLDRCYLDKDNVKTPVGAIARTLVPVLRQ